MKDRARAIKELAASIGRPVRLMEVCGTHTVAIFRHGIRQFLPEGLQLLSGPGCPVCVTSIRDVDTVIALSRMPGMIITTFGDMMRVPGSGQNLFHAKAEGADIRVVYSPLDALKLAEESPGRMIVFFATGFETTSPLVAGTLAEAERKGVENFFIYSVHKTVPPALRALLSAAETAIDGFILPGHVSTIIGLQPYAFLADEFRKPSVVTGFDAADIMGSIVMLLSQIADGRASVDNEYAGVVKPGGNTRAVALLEEFFEPEDAYWRGIGVLPGSGLKLRERYRHRCITDRFAVEVPDGREPAGCSCGEVLKGLKIPTDCPLFGKVCRPDSPIGACMVSTEGSCAAYYKYANPFMGGKPPVGESR